MRATFLILAALALTVRPSEAQAHGKGGGFHKRLQAVVQQRKVSFLITLDLDSGPKAQHLRRGADTNKDQRLSDEELAALRSRLAELAAKPLSATISGHPLRPAVVEAKLATRKDRTVSETGVSIAVLLEAPLPDEVTPGLELVLADEAPDGSHVHVVAQEETPDGGVGGEARKALQPGDRLTLRLRGAL